MSKFTDWLRGIFRARSGTSRSRDEPGAQWQSVGYTTGDRHMMGSEMIYSAVARVSNTMASMKLNLYKDGQIYAEHPLNRLVSYEPSPRVNAFEFRRTMQANAQDAGRSYAVIRRAADGVTPLRLEIADPYRVIDVIVRQTDEVWHRVSWEDGTDEWVPNVDMICLRGMSTNGVHGISQHTVLRGALDYDRAVKQYTSQQMTGVNSTITITVPGTGLSKEKQQKIIDEFWEVYQKSGGKAVLLQGGMTLGDLTHSPFDAQAAEIGKMTANRVATVNMVPPHLLGDYSDTSYSTAEQDMIEFRQTTLLSLVVQWETELDRKLLTWEAINKDRLAFHFDMGGLMRADTITMANKHSISVRCGTQTINEARKEDGLPPVEGGDVPLVSRDLAPLGQQVTVTGQTNGGNQ